MNLLALIRGIGGQGIFIWAIPIYCIGIIVALVCCIQQFLLYRRRKDRYHYLYCIVFILYLVAIVTVNLAMTICEPRSVGSLVLGCISMLSGVAGVILFIRATKLRRLKQKRG